MKSGSALGTRSHAVQPVAAVLPGGEPLASVVVRDTTASGGHGLDIARGGEATGPDNLPDDHARPRASIRRPVVRTSWAHATPHAGWSLIREVRRNRSV